MQTDLVRSEKKAPFARPLFLGSHAEYPLIEDASARDIRDGQHDMIELVNVHLPGSGSMAEIVFRQES
jgi:hypothetical protein